VEEEEEEEEEQQQHQQQKNLKLHQAIHDQEAQRQ